MAHHLDQLERRAEATAHAARLVGETRNHYHRRTRVARAMLAEIRRAKKRGAPDGDD